MSLPIEKISTQLIRKRDLIFRPTHDDFIISFSLKWYKIKPALNATSKVCIAHRATKDCVGHLNRHSRYFLAVYIPVVCHYINNDQLVKVQSTHEELGSQIASNRALTNISTIASCINCQNVHGYIIKVAVSYYVFNGLKLDLVMVVNYWIIFFTP